MLVPCSLYYRKEKDFVRMLQNLYKGNFCVRDLFPDYVIEGEYRDIWNSEVLNINLKMKSHSVVFSFNTNVGKGVIDSFTSYCSELRDFNLLSFILDCSVETHYLNSATGTCSDLNDASYVRSVISYNLGNFNIPKNCYNVTFKVLAMNKVTKKEQILYVSEDYSRVNTYIKNFPTTNEANYLEGIRVVCSLHMLEAGEWFPVNIEKDEV